MASFSWFVALDRRNFCRQRTSISLAAAHNRKSHANVAAMGKEVTEERRK
jgi:hypothetical protein